VPPAVALWNYISSVLFWRIFFPNWDFRGVFSYYHYFVVGPAKLRCAGNIIFFKVPHSPFIRDRDIEGGEIEEGGCE
jgi:hypothetical protein